MDIKKLQRAIVDGLEDVKAQDIVVFNTEHLSPLFERVIIASGTSNRQTKSLAASVRDAVRGCGEQVLATEGEDNGEWIIVDCAAAVVHIMQPSIREYYRLEEIWGGKVVKLKLGKATSGLVKASEPDDEAEAPAPKTARRGAKGAAKGKTVAVMADQPAPRPAAKRAAAKKAVPAKKAAARTAASKTAAAKTTAAKKAPGKRSAPVREEATQTLVVKPAKPSTKPGAKRAAAAKTSGRGAPAPRGAAKPATATRGIAAKKAPARRPSGRG